mgnify:CR=1 FL=1
MSKLKRINNAVHLEAVNESGNIVQIDGLKEAL